MKKSDHVNQSAVWNETNFLPLGEFSLFAVFHIFLSHLKLKTKGTTPNPNTTTPNQVLAADRFAGHRLRSIMDRKPSNPSSNRPCHEMMLDARADDVSHESEQMRRVKFNNCIFLT